MTSWISLDKTECPCPGRILNDISLISRQHFLLWHICYYVHISGIYKLGGGRPDIFKLVSKADSLIRFKKKSSTSVKRKCMVQQELNFKLETNKVLLPSSIKLRWTVKNKKVGDKMMASEKMKNCMKVVMSGNCLANLCRKSKDTESG